MEINLLDPGLLQRVLAQFSPGWRLARGWALVGGMSAHMAAFEGISPQGQRQAWVLRCPAEGALQRSSRAAAEEYDLLNFLAARGLPVPRPYWVDESRSIVDWPYLVMEYVDGQVVLAPPDLASSLRQAAEALAAVHACGQAARDLPYLPMQSPLCEELGRGEPPPSAGPLDEGWIYAALRVAKEPVLLNSNLVEDSQPASTSTPPRPLALLHGDFWPGNLLWRQGQLVSIIDWEDAALGDPLVDFSISRLDVALMFGPSAMRTFSRFYCQAAALNLDSLPYWDLCAALRLARLANSYLPDWVSFYRDSGRPDLTPALIVRRINAFVRQAARAAGAEDRLK